MESVLLDILAAQREMLGELRQIRLLLAERGQFLREPLPEPPAYLDVPGDVPGEPDQVEFTLEPETTPAAPKSSQPQGGFTPRELKDLGPSFATPRAAKSRPGMVDVSDLRGSLVDEIKGKNRVKSRAFDEFSKYRRDD